MLRHQAAGSSIARGRHERRTIQIKDGASGAGAASLLPNVNLFAVEPSSLASSSARVGTESLSVRLKTRTALAYSRVEKVLDLPTAIRDRPDYERRLSRRTSRDRYVLMGATLGGRHILRGLAPLLGAALGPATRFLKGGGPSTGSDRLACRDVLDDFGRRYPERRGDVVTGATARFPAPHRWFVPFCAERDRSR